jgi:hypothetical protein
LQGGHSHGKRGPQSFDGDDPYQAVGSAKDFLLLLLVTAEELQSRQGREFGEFFRENVVNEDTEDV